MTQPKFKSELLFSNKYLLKMIFPLIIEQFLLISVGIADIFMVSSLGEAAVSGISTIDVINVLLNQILIAVATGGAVVISHHLGKHDNNAASNSAKQLLYVVFFPSCLISIGLFFFHTQILSLLFKDLESAVMANACAYLQISALSYPFLAIYHAGSAIYRAQGITKTSMFVSVLMNILNIIGNALLIYGFHLGVAGAAIASLFSHIFAAATMLILITRPSHYIFIQKIRSIQLDRATVKSILKIGIPGGIENGLFHIGKILLQGLVSVLGTTALAANALANNLAGITTIPALALCTTIITVVGQCVGANDYEQAEHFIKKFTGYCYLSLLVFNTTLYFIAPNIVSLYGLSPEVSQSATEILRIFALGCIFVWVPSFLFPNALRASGDSTFTMSVSMISMWAFRIGLSYILALNLSLGLLGVWIAMLVDWAVRAIVFSIRLSGTKWKTKTIL